MNCSFLSFFIVLTLSSFVAQGQIEPAKDAPQPKSPLDSLACVRLPEGFQMDLVASEPLIADPSGVAFDEHGRMFVCELHGYNIEGHIDTQALNKTGELDTTVRRIRWELQGGEIAEEAARQQFGIVRMLTDNDGDGVMDTSTIWADDLPPCYGLVAARGGIIVTCAPDIVFLADHDGDGVPEIRETLFTGFNSEVLERGINNPCWGIDNWIYIGSGGAGGTISGPHLDRPLVLGNTDFRIKSNGTAIEPVNGRVGTFGMTMNDVGDRFPSTGGLPAVYALPLPYRYLKRNPYVASPDSNHTAAHYNRGFRISQPHPWRVKRRQDPNWIKFYGDRETNSNFFSGGCSTTFYGDPLFPAPYRGDLFYCEPSLNIIHRTRLKRDGPGYVAERAPSEKESEFLASTDQWFRPMNLHVGPDGALYIVDMYREIIEDYSAIPRFLQQQYGLDKGKTKGRLWRLRPKNGTFQVWPDLSGLNSASLKKAALSPYRWHRDTARRLFIENNLRAIATGLANNFHVQEWNPPAAINLLYILDELALLKPSHVMFALGHKNYAVRIHALRLSEPWLSSDPDLLTKITAMKEDSDVSVRLQLAMTLGHSHDDAAVKTLIYLATRFGDERWMDSALLSSANNRNIMPLLEGVLTHPAAGKARSLLKPLAATVGGRGDGGDSGRLLKVLAELDEERQSACLSGLIESSSAEALGRIPDVWTAIAPMLNSSSLEIKQLAVQMASQLPEIDQSPLDSLFADASARALDTTNTVAERQRALQLFAHAGYDILASVAEKLLHPKQMPVLQEAIIDALDRKTDPRVGETLLAYWPKLTPALRKRVATALVARENRIPTLVNALEQGLLHSRDLSAVQRDQLVSTKDETLARRAVGILKNAPSNEEMQRRLAKYQEALHGERDVEAGARVYAANCVVCHKLENEGNEIGPSLESITERPDESVLADILDPASQIDPVFRLYLVTTTEGETLAGVLASESSTSVTLRQSDGGMDVVLRKNISTMGASDLSLMPANFHELISPKDVADLLVYMRGVFARENR